MPTANGDVLPYGQDALVPTDSPGAWGARLIVTQDGYVDFLADRAGLAGEKDRLIRELESRIPPNKLFDKIGDLLRGGRMHTRKGEDIVVFDDGVVEAHANTNGSAGYCYVTAWLKPEGSKA